MSADDFTPSGAEEAAFTIGIAHGRRGYPEAPRGSCLPQEREAYLTGYSVGVFNKLSEADEDEIDRRKLDRHFGDQHAEGRP